MVQIIPIENDDSTLIVVVKALVISLTIIVAAYEIIKKTTYTLKHKNRQMGFGKGIGG